MHTDVWSDITEVPHVRIGQQADLVVVAPATADLLARAATGQADDLLTNVLLTARCPVVMAPAMHTEMWEHPATQANVATLTERGVHVVPPASGRLTGIARPRAAARARGAVRRVRARAGSRHGRGPARVDAGGEDDDRSPGRRRRGHAGAPRPGPLPRQPVVGQAGPRPGGEAAARGADVTLVTTACPGAPAGVRVVEVETAREMQDAVRRAAEGSDLVVMAAAVADFRPAAYAEHKIKKTHEQGAGGEPTSRLPRWSSARTPDILAGLVSARGAAATPVVVGFAAETGDGDGSVLDHGRRSWPARAATCSS